MLNFAQRFHPIDRRLVVRPLVVGGRWRPIDYADSSAVVQLLYYRLGYPAGEGVTAVCPEVPSGMARLMREQNRPEIDALSGPRCIRPRITLDSLRTRRYRRAHDNEPPGLGTSTLARMVAHARYYVDDLYLAERERSARDTNSIYGPIRDQVYSGSYRMLRDRNVITDVSRVGIRSDGRPADDRYDSLDLEDCWLGVHPGKLRRWREEGTNTILVVAGSMLGPALRAALEVRCYATLIIDTALAIQLLPLEKRPEVYRGIPDVTGDDGYPPLEPTPGLTTARDRRTQQKATRSNARPGRSGLRSAENSRIGKRTTQRRFPRHATPDPSAAGREE